ncbi:acetyl/propionyl/methylcrotonyl-CoA carboxylase subunit alpha [Algicola sagamiensis]|uniref:acetyl/propionyl/methylcrotonyl-CoA carboxylase subunit alpha n=1 Tax=Algicola sagamiensis TaxID=163869 RepID=UPI00036CCEE8|nr:acetyl/propionyl/methylcrotonyl-CoA carboxylase subunit alpha [Algicola sagamiensis]
MFKSILIANRGEIACRIIDTAHQLGIRCIAVYSDADREARHVALADEAYHIGPSPSQESYLCVDKIIDIATRAEAQAIHPGYGFLSESPILAKACQENGLVFIGPPIQAIESMGSKSAAKMIMEQAGVPLISGYHGENQDESHLCKQAQKIGYPVLLKAAFGGGGKGMRVVENARAFSESLAGAKREALASFGNDKILIEKYLTQPRHVEVQVFADQHGNCIYLADRDCSIQRRHQKIIEEAPAPDVPDDIRKAMGESAVRAAKAIDYVGAGTVEFLYDNGDFYFMEMNTRLQVEHPVTEMITGQDLVRWQLHVATGGELPLTQEEVTIEGHAIEARIYAEDPDNDFLPATGKLNYLRQPNISNHLRVDTGVRENDEVSTFYDPMIAKLIAWDESREQAIRRLTSGIDEYRISGVQTNLEFLSNILEHTAFHQKELNTRFIETHHQVLFSEGYKPCNRALALVSLYLILAQTQERQRSANTSQDPYSPWHAFNGWRLNQTQKHTLVLIDASEVEHEITINQNLSNYQITIDGHLLKASGTLNEDHLTASIDGHQVNVRVAAHGEQITLFEKQNVYHFVQKANLSTPEEESHQDESGLLAPMNGTIVSILTEVGHQVSAGEPLVIMEAMKMEYTIAAPYDGKIDEVYFKEGDLIQDGAELLSMIANEEKS